MKSKLEAFRKDIICRYIKNETCKDIGIVYNIYPETVRRFLIKNGISIRKKGARLGRKAWNKNLNARINSSVQKQQTSYRLNKSHHTRPPGICSDKIKENIRRNKIRKKILERYESGWLPKAGRCAKIAYNSPIAGNVLLDGSWELKFAKFLDKHNIPWMRNKKRFKYINENNVESHYTPDFYLLNSNIYVEVKGYETEKDRCKWKHFPEKLFVLKKEDISNIKNNSFNLESIIARCYTCLLNRGIGNPG